MEKILTCISCPMGCQITVTKNEDGQYNFEGYTCKRGLKYATDEMTNPKRVLTTTMKVVSGKENVVSVKTNDAIAKEKLFEAMDIINKTTLQAPVKIKQVVLKNIVNSNVDVIATKNIEKI